MEYDGCINLMKAAIEVSERFSTVSPTYAREIQTAQYAHGLQDIICKNAFKLTGILNGIDIQMYNPEIDKALFANYTATNFEGKKICKKELQKMLGLPEKDVPIIAMISRLVSHKGLELVKTVAEDILHEDVQFVLLGTGDYAYEEYFRDLGKKYEGKASINIAFNGDLSKKIYSGADIFLMPSVSEPCGLSQMIASRYATVPLVRETGGLYDSIKPYGAGGNGFTFASCNPYDMLYVIHEALGVYKNSEQWTALMKKAATTDFSWQRSAEEYKKLYDVTFHTWY
jgi:starch synthase